MSHSDELITHEKAADEYIVDADFHLHMSPENLYPYVDDPMIQEKLKQSGPPPFGGIWPKTAYAKRPEAASEEPWAARHGGAFTAADIVAVKDRMGIDVTVVTPGTKMPWAAACIRGFERADESVQRLRA